MFNYNIVSKSFPIIICSFIDSLNHYSIIRCNNSRSCTCGDIKCTVVPIIVKAAHNIVPSGYGPLKIPLPSGDYYRT